MGQNEMVVLLDESGAPAGTALKAEVHTSNTPLHLAFSCYLLDRTGRLLVTRRALTKRTWPGVWTNSFCRHPGPGENNADAVRRRAGQELGTSIEAVTERLPDFRYRAVDASGTVEHELCPVFTAIVDRDIAPSVDEIMDWDWVDPEALQTAVESAPFAFSPWLREQLPLLHATGAFVGGPSHA
ncbi:isopentenyl-diphosphate Delta-isomerase [Mycetocola reblochoni]|uniref:Isopentenyl-diphosphate Delta-isomerase n=2 Tax=Mycetocola reblochoni TaxID=331618 RepID=A0A1R4J063_9MICO|nr:isopentenyl-diphosphate Delta-isomerase [Mycetocola reblochoni]RLP67551.1 isopentenyl-diphosphate Delta-isomerase [Mycetocola reblochoni]SJN25492.1 Isopentenyl-diphosphate delta-isomerase [Mycetocola reblochoni REB411]